MANPAIAENCPHFYRFVDFGSKDNEGVTRRGGSIFRAFDQNNTSLLVPEYTICLNVPELAKDGRLLPVPVVSRIEVDLNIAKIDLQSLRLRSSNDVFSVSQVELAPHQTTLALAEAERTQGEGFLCAAVPNSDIISCQVLSPYAVAAPLVIYCDNTHCDMPALARNDHVLVSARWKRAGATDLLEVGFEISGKIQSLYEFLANHT